MRIIYYDLETTGLDPVRSDIIQAAYAVFDNGKCVRSDIMHFFYENMSRSSPEALEKHGMTYEYLSQYKDEFERNCKRLYSILDHAHVAGFNNKRFDDYFSTIWLRRMYAPELIFSESTDVMLEAAPIVNKPRISLINLCKHFELTEDKINAACSEWFGTTGSAHSAYYDVAATRLCHMKEVEIIEKANRETSMSTSADDAFDDLF